MQKPSEHESIGDKIDDKNVAVPPGLEEAICEDGRGGAPCDDEIIGDKKWKDMDYGEARVLFWVRIIIIIFASVMSLAVVGIFLGHMVMPTSWRWLSPQEVSAIKDLAMTIIVGVTMSFTTTYFFKKKAKKK